MRLLALSDTHFEFQADHGGTFVDWIWNENKSNPPDIVVLAGDISNVDHLRASIKMFAEKFPCPIVFVHGNHEYYGTTPHNALEKTRKFELDFDETYWLEPYPDDYPVNSNVRSRVKLTGGTLWFPEPDSTARKDWMNDFQEIFDFEPWVYQQYKRTVEHLEKHIRPGGVVITHHSPSLKSIHPRYEGSPINQFFASDLEWLIESKRPSLWIQGHTHESLDYRIGDTRIVCNPFGYTGIGENKNFNPKLIIEV